MAEWEQGADVLTTALVSVVHREGPGVGAEPRRLRACLDDELMGQAREHLVDLDALVLAAEVGIPDALQRSGFDQVAAQRRLLAREVDEATASRAVDRWAAALGRPGDRSVEVPSRSRRAVLLVGGAVALVAVVAVVILAFDRPDGVASEDVLVAETRPPATPPTRSVERTTTLPDARDVGLDLGHWTGPGRVVSCTGAVPGGCEEAERRWEVWVDCTSGACFLHGVWWGAGPEAATEGADRTWVAQQSDAAFSCLGHDAGDVPITRVVTVWVVEPAPTDTHPLAGADGLRLRIEDSVPPGPCGEGTEVWEVDADRAA